MEQAIERKNVTMRIMHSDLEVKELSELLYIINLSINDYYRDNGVASNQLGCYAPTIHAVRQGSIELDLVLDLLKEIAVGVAIELLVGYMSNRIRMLLKKYKGGKTKRQIFDYEITTRIEVRIEAGKILFEVKKRSLIAGMDESL